MLLLGKFKAASLHGLITAVVASFTALIVFVIWFPGEMSEMARGSGLYRLVILVELVLGPLMSLVIYNPRKPKVELFRDYLVIGLVQLSAFGYGLYAVSVSRPVYLVFVKDRIEVVAASELGSDDLLKAAEEFQALPWLGPRWVCVEYPVDKYERSNLLMSALEGKDIQLLPYYYRDCDNGEITSHSYSMQNFPNLTPHSLDVLPVELLNEGFVWLPVVTRFGAWTVFFSGGDERQPVFINLFPFNSSPVEDATQSSSINPQPGNASLTPQSK